MEGFFRVPGGHDFNCDQLSVVSKMILSELLGTCSFRYDGEIPNMLCTLFNGQTPSKAAIQPTGFFHFKDDYGAIYDGSWETKGDDSNKKFDISYVIKIPYVWGEPTVGFIKNRKIFRRGIVTRIRQIITIHPNGSYSIDGTVNDQKIELFQINVTCGDNPFVDDFCFHYDCSILDEITGEVRCGSRWTDIEDIDVVWPSLITDTSGNVISYDTGGKQPFQFMDVWHNDEAQSLTAVCASGSS